MDSDDVFKQLLLDGATVESKGRPYQVPIFAEGTAGEERWIQQIFGGGWKFRVDKLMGYALVSDVAELSVTEGAVEVLGLRVGAREIDFPPCDAAELHPDRGGRTISFEWDEMLQLGVHVKWHRDAKLEMTFFGEMEMEEA